MSQPYRIRSEETWAQARADYLAGDTAEMVCRRYALLVDTFRKRAAREGWRRSDQDDPAPAPDGPDDAWDDGLTDERRAALAKRRADWALQQGDLPRARGWLRVAAEYRRLSPPAPAPARPDLADMSALRRMAEAGVVEAQACTALANAEADAVRAGLATQFHQFHPESQPPAASRLQLSLLKAEIERPPVSRTCRA